MSKDKLGLKPKKRMSGSEIADANNKRPWSLPRVKLKAERCPECRRKIVLPCMVCEAERAEQVKRVQRLLPQYWR